MSRTPVVTRPLPTRRGPNVQRTISVIAAVLLAVGTPIGLTRFGVPLAGVDWPALGNQLRIGDVPRSFLVGVVTVLAWLLWANFVWAFAVEWRAQLAGVQAPSIPVAPGTQYLARRIVSGLLFSVHSFGVIAMPPPDLHAVQPVVSVVDDGATHQAPTTDQADTESTAPPTYLVGRGDTLMSIADEVLGDDDRWTEIRRLNIGQTRPDGSVMQASETWVMLGQRLLLPPDAVIPESPSPQVVADDDAGPTLASPAEPSSSDISRVVEVQAGDNLWSLSAEALEDGWSRGVADSEVAVYHHEVVETNRSALTSVPADPDLIFPGDRFVLPEIPADPVVSRSAEPTESTSPDPASRGAAASSSAPPSSARSNPSVPPAGDVSGRPGTETTTGPRPNDDNAPGSVDDESADAGGEDDQTLFPGFVDSRDGGTLWAMVPDDRAGDPAAQSSPAPEASEDGSGPGSADDGSARNPDRGENVTGSDTGQNVTGSDPDQKVTGSDPDQKVTGSDPDQKVTGSETGQKVTDRSNDGRAEESNRSVVIGTIGAGLLAAAFVRAFRRRRRIQWQQRQPGRIPEPLDATESLALARLEAIADYERLDSTEQTLTTYDVPESTHVVVDDQEVSVFVPDEPAQMFPAPPETEDPQETSFVVDEKVDAWVSLGRDVADGDVVVNLATIERLWVSVASGPADGPVVRPADVVTALAVEMATSSLNTVRVVLLDPISELCLERVVVVPDEAALVRFIESDPNGLERPPVVASTVALSDAVQRTVQRRRLPLITVGARPKGDRGWSCEVRAQGSWIDPLATLVQRDWFDEAAMTSLSGAIARSARDRDTVGPGSLAYEDADTEADIDGVDGPTVALQRDGEPPPRPARVTPAAVAVADTGEGGDTVAEPEVPTVRVLGRVEITGLQKRLESLRAMGLITYLAFHRDGADADRLITWVWPDGAPPTKKAFANVVSRARTALGVDSDGEPFLQKADANGVYRLSKRVTTDFDALIDILERIGQSDADAQLSAYQSALELVRGVPFTGGGAHGFAWTDHGLRAHVDYTIDEAAHAYADLAISIGETERARWATRIGLQIVAGCEGCYRRRFAAAAADGNHAELRAAMAELERVVSDDLGEPEASDAISGDLLAYYDSLIEGQGSPTPVRSS